MKYELLLLSLALLCGHVCCDDNSDVIELDEASFNEGVKVDIMLVEFFAPWCGHCKKLAPEYETAATQLKKNDPPVPLAKVDCTASSAVCSKFGVSGYPTLKIFRDGELSADYSGPRSAPGIVDYMRKQSGPSSRELSDADAVRNFIDHDEHTIVGFFKSDSSPLKEAFVTASNTLRENFRFGHTSAVDAVEEFGYEDNVVIFQPPFMKTKLEPSPFVYTGAAQAERLKTFIKEDFMGIAGVRDFDTQKFFEEKKPLCVVYFDVEYSLDPKGTNYWRNRVIKVAKKFEGQINFAVSDRDDFMSELEALGITDKTQPSAGIYDKRGKFSMGTKGKFSVDSLTEFVQDYLDDKLETYMKSEPVPQPNDGPVKIVVGRNFDEIVNDPSKDVLIEFYAPWCGHCKALAPKFDELGEKFKDDPNIVIAKTDATGNDYPPGFEVRGYPSLYWVPAGNKSKPRKYEGGREVDDFIKYIKDNATNPPVIAGEKKKKKKGKKEEL